MAQQGVEHLVDRLDQAGGGVVGILEDRHVGKLFVEVDAGFGLELGLQVLEEEGLVVQRAVRRRRLRGVEGRSEEHTSELQSLMRISYAVFCLKKQKEEQV